MRHLPLFLLFACEAPLETLQSSVHTEALLELSPDDLRERARPLPNTLARLHPGSEPLLADDWPGQGLKAYPVVEADEAVAILWEGGVLRLVLWLDRVDLPISPVQATWMGGPGVGIRLPAGTPVEELESSGRHTRVHALGDRLKVDAWVSSARLDNWWYDEDAPDWIGDGTTPVRILDGAELFDAPDGVRVGQTLPDAQFSAWIAEKSGPYLRVTHAGSAWMLNAWVHEEDTEPRNSFGSGWGRTFSGTHRCGGRMPNVRKDVFLLDAPGGDVVGKVTERTWLPIEGAAGDWQRVEISTSFGTADLWLAPEDVE